MDRNTCLCILNLILSTNLAICEECTFSYYDYPTRSQKTKTEECTTSCCHDQAKCCQETSTQAIIIGVSIAAAVLVIFLLAFTVLCFKNYSTRKTKVKMLEQQKEKRKKKNKVNPESSHMHPQSYSTATVMEHFNPFQQQPLPGAFNEFPANT